MRDKCEGGGVCEGGDVCEGSGVCEGGGVCVQNVRNVHIYYKCMSNM